MTKQALLPPVLLFLIAAPVYAQVCDAGNGEKLAEELWKVCRNTDPDGDCFSVSMARLGMYYRTHPDLDRAAYHLCILSEQQKGSPDAEAKCDAMVETLDFSDYEAGGAPAKTCGCLENQEFTTSCKSYTHVRVMSCSDLYTLYGWSAWRAPFLTCMVDMEEGGFVVGGDPDELCLRSEVAFSSDPDELKNEGKAVCDGDMQIAASYFSKALENTDDDDETYAFILYNTAKCYDIHSEFTKAIEHYEDAYGFSGLVDDALDRLDFRRDASAMLGGAHADNAFTLLRSIDDRNFAPRSQIKYNLLKAVFWLKRAKSLGLGAENIGSAWVYDYYDTALELLRMLTGSNDVEQRMDGILDTLGDDTITDGILEEVFEQELLENDLDLVNILDTGEIDLQKLGIRDPTKALQRQFEEKKAEYRRKADERYSDERTSQVLGENREEFQDMFDIVPNEQLNAEEFSSIKQAPPGGAPGPEGAGRRDTYSPDKHSDINNLGGDNDWANSKGNGRVQYVINPPGTYYFKESSFPIIDENGNAETETYQEVLYPQFTGADRMTVRYRGLVQSFQGLGIKELPVVDSKDFSEYFVDRSRVQIKSFNDPNLRPKFILFIGKDRTPILVLDSPYAEELIITYEIIRVNPGNVDQMLQDVPRIEATTYVPPRVINDPLFRQMEADFTASLAPDKQTEVTADRDRYAQQLEAFMQGYFDYANSGSASGPEWYRGVLADRESDCDTSNQLFNIMIRKQGAKTLLATGWLAQNGIVYEQMTKHGWSRATDKYGFFKRFDATSTSNSPDDLKKLFESMNRDPFNPFGAMENEAFSIISDEAIPLQERLVRLDMIMERAISEFIEARNSYREYQKQEQLDASFHDFDRFFNQNLDYSDDARDGWWRTRGRIKSKLIEVFAGTDGITHQYRALYVKYDLGICARSKAFPYMLRGDIHDITEYPFPLRLIELAIATENGCMFQYKLYFEHNAKELLQEFSQMGDTDMARHLTAQYHDAASASSMYSFVDALENPTEEGMQKLVARRKKVMDSELRDILDNPADAFGILTDYTLGPASNPVNMFYDSFPANADIDEETYQNFFNLFVSRLSHPESAVKDFEDAKTELVTAKLRQILPGGEDPDAYQRAFGQLTFQDVLDEYTLYDRTFMSGYFGPYHTGNEYREGDYLIKIPFRIIDSLDEPEKRKERYKQLIELGVTRMANLDPYNEPFTDYGVNMYTYFINKGLYGLEELYQDGVVSRDEIAMYRSITAIAVQTGFLAKDAFGDAYYGTDGFDSIRATFDTERFNDNMINFFSIVNTYPRAIDMARRIVERTSTDGDLRLKAVQRMISVFPIVYPHMWDTDTSLGQYHYDVFTEETPYYFSNTDYYYSFYKALMRHFSYAATDIAFHDGEYDDEQAPAIAPLIVYPLGTEGTLVDSTLSQRLLPVRLPDKQNLRRAVMVTLKNYIENELTRESMMARRSGGGSGMYNAIAMYERSVQELSRFQPMLDTINTAYGLNIRLQDLGYREEAKSLDLLRISESEW
ncbi:MAG: hypothetical protein ABH879_02150 [archaeon]